MWHGGCHGGCHPPSKTHHTPVQGLHGGVHGGVQVWHGVCHTPCSPFRRGAGTLRRLEPLKSQKSVVHSSQD